MAVKKNGVDLYVMIRKCTFDVLLRKRRFQNNEYSVIPFYFFFF